MIDVYTLLRALECCKKFGCDAECPYTERCRKQGGTPKVIDDAIIIINELLSTIEEQRETIEEQSETIFDLTLESNLKGGNEDE